MEYDVKSRIKKRRNARFKKEQSRSNILSFFSSIFMILSIALGVLIYGKTDENGTWLKENFGIELSFVNINKTISKYVDSLLNFDIFSFNKNDFTVNNDLKYLYLGNNMYKSSGSEIVSVGSGRILNIDGEFGDYTIKIQHDYGYIGIYSEIDDIFVKENDYVKNNAVIGNDYDEVMISFILDSEEITYEEVLELSK